MNKLIAVGLAIMMAAVALPGVDATDHARHETTQYVPGAATPRWVVSEDEEGNPDTAFGTWITAAWCSAEEHSLVPNRDPPAIRTDDPVNTTWDYEAWAWSGEPECAYSDAINAGQEAACDDDTHENNCRESLGIGAAAWLLEATELGGSIQTNTRDQNFGNDRQWQEIYYRVCVDSEGNDTACDPEDSNPPSRAEWFENCGQLNIDLPSNIEHHWQGGIENPYWIAWNFVYEVGIQPDLSLCLSSTGFIDAVIESA